MKRFKYLGAALLAGIICLTSGCGRSHKEVATAKLASVERVGLEKFAELDTNNDGLIDEAELLRGAKWEHFNAADRDVIRHMYDYRSWIGHFVGSKTEEVPVTTLVPMPDGNGGFWYLPQTTWETQTTNFYAISKRDLETYRERLPAFK